MNRCQLDDPRRKEQPVHLPLERYNFYLLITNFLRITKERSSEGGVFSYSRLRNRGELIDVVPSSDPNSQEGLDQDELAGLLQDSNGYTPSQERFHKSTADPMSFTYKSHGECFEVQYTSLFLHYHLNSFDLYSETS